MTNFDEIEFKLEYYNDKYDPWELSMDETHEPAVIYDPEFVWNMAVKTKNTSIEKNVSAVTYTNLFEAPYWDDDTEYSTGSFFRQRISGWICELLGIAWDYTEDFEKQTTTFFNTNALVDKDELYRNPQKYIFGWKNNSTEEEKKK